MEYLIRKIERSDLNTLVDLCAKHADYEGAGFTGGHKYERLEAEIFSINPGLHCYMIDCRGIIGGYFSFTFDFSTWDAQTFLYLDCLYLEPEFRGLRIGEAVFDKLKQIAVENNCVNIQWQTPVEKQRAISFYHRIGGVSSAKARFKLETGI